MPASQPPLVAAHSSSSMNWPIVGIAVVGILTTSVFLLAYYVFVIKCCLNWRRSDFLLRLFSASRRYPFPSNVPTESTGLDPSTIHAIPTFIYPGIPSAAECAVCLSEFRGGERLRLLSGCAHAFHIDCIDTWLQSNASCPLCRAHITDSSPPPADNHVIATQSSVTEAADGAAGDPRRKLEHTVSMGDECIEPSRENKEELFPVQPLRRSLSTNSSCHRQLYISVQEILRLNPDLLCFEGSSSGGRGSGRVRRSFFPFAYGRNAMRAVETAGMNV